MYSSSIESDFSLVPRLGDILIALKKENSNNAVSVLFWLQESLHEFIHWSQGAQDFKTSKETFTWNLHMGNNFNLCCADDKVNYRNTQCLNKLRWITAKNWASLVFFFTLQPCMVLLKPCLVVHCSDIVKIKTALFFHAMLMSIWHTTFVFEKERS